MKKEKLTKEVMWKFIPEGDKHVAGVYDSGEYLTVKLNDYEFSSSWNLMHMHRYIMQQYLNRKLETFEHVHHIDGNKKNNDLSNLELLINHEHRHNHSTDHVLEHGELVRMFICPMCETIFTRRDLSYRKLARTCSRECKNDMCSKLNSNTFTSRHRELITNNYIGQYRIKDDVYHEVKEDDFIFRPKANNKCKECGIKIGAGSEYCKKHHLELKVHVKTLEDKFCACGNQIYNNSTQCKECYLKSMSTNEKILANGIKNRKVERPSKETLMEEIQKYNMTQMGNKYGVSDNAIRKWCRQYEIDLSLGISKRRIR